MRVWLQIQAADSRRVVVSYKRKYVHEVLDNCFIKLGQEKSVVRWTDRPAMTIAVDFKQQNKQPPTEKKSSLKSMFESVGWESEAKLKRAKNYL